MIKYLSPEETVTFPSRRNTASAVPCWMMSMSPRTFVAVRDARINAGMHIITTNFIIYSVRRHTPTVVGVEGWPCLL